MKRFIFLSFVTIVALSLLPGCSRCADKVKDALEAKGVAAIEFFPEGPSRDPFKKPERIHWNIRYDSKGNDLIIKIDDWHFKGSRKNVLRVYSIPLSKINPDSIRIISEKMPVGPVSYKGKKTKVEPCKILLQTYGKDVLVETYDKGTGPRIAPGDAERFRMPKKGTTLTQTDRVEVYASNENKAQIIVGAIKGCL